MRHDVSVSKSVEFTQHFRAGGAMEEDVAQNFLKEFLLDVAEKAVRQEVFQQESVCNALDSLLDTPKDKLKPSEALRAMLENEE